MLRPGKIKSFKSKSPLILITITFTGFHPLMLQAAQRDPAAAAAGQGDVLQPGPGEQAAAARGQGRGGGALAPAQAGHRDRHGQEAHPRTLQALLRHHQRGRSRNDRAKYLVVCRKEWIKGIFPPSLISKTTVQVCRIDQIKLGNLYQVLSASFKGISIRNL